MSIELELLPMQQGLKSGYSFAVIRAGYMSGEGCAAVQTLNQLPIGEIYTRMEPQDLTPQDAYGEKLKYTTAEEFVPVSEKFFLKTATAFLKALDPQTPVVLYWH